MNTMDTRTAPEYRETSVLVSVVVPAFNADSFIERAVRSVLQQTEQSFEVIVVDDASTDDTVETVTAIQDSRIRLLKNETNRGPSVSRNRALEVAKGTWIALLDADDWYRAHRLQRLVEAAEAHSADMVADDIYFVEDGATVDLDLGVVRDARGYPRPLHRLFRNTILPVVLKPTEFVGGQLPGGNDPRLALTKPIIRREFLLSNDIRYEEKALYGEDYLFYLDCLGAGARWVLVDEQAYCYRSHSSMRSHHDRLKTQRNRAATNRLLLERPYVTSNPELKRRLKKRQEGLEAESSRHAFKREFKASSSIEKIWAVLNAPSDFWEDMRNRFRQRAGRLKGRVRRIPVRIRQLLGLYPTWDEVLHTREFQ